MARVTRKTHLPAPVTEAMAIQPVPRDQADRRGRAALTVETAFDQWLTMLTQFPDPDEVLKNLGIRREHLRALEYDDEISAALDTRREAIIGVPWRLEPGTDAASKFIADELRPHVEKIVRSGFAAVCYGYSVSEVVYAWREGGLGLGAVVEIPFWWFSPRPDGKLVWYSQKEPNGEEADPLKFLLTVRQSTYLSPYGEALLSRLYWPWKFRQAGWKFWAKWLERFGSPFLIARTKGDINAMSKALAAASGGAGIAVDAEDEVSALDAGSKGDQFSSFEGAIIRRYQRVILGQTLTSDVGQSGSYAAAKVHNDVREDKRNADIRLVRATFQKIVNNLWALNRFSGTAPEFVMEDETGLEIDRADRDSKLVQAGILKLTEDYLMDRYDFREGDFEIPEPPPQLAPYAGQDPNAAQDGQKAPPKGGGTESDQNARDAGASATKAGFAAQTGPRFTQGQEAVERLVDNTLSGLPPLIEEAAILRVIRLAKDPEDLLERMAVLMRNSSSPEFRTMFERALFAAEVMGFAHADDPEADRFASFAASAPIINVTAQFEPPPAPTVVVNVPEQSPPVVNVTNEVPLPSVTVEATPAVTLNATVEIPPRKTVTEIERDADGNIKRAVQTDGPADGATDGRTLN